MTCRRSEGQASGELSVGAARLAALVFVGEIGAVAAAEAIDLADRGRARRW